MSYIYTIVDEVIYGKTDWDNLLGAQRNRYFLWNEDGGLIEQKQAPRAPLPSEDDISSDALEVGGEYPGSYRGDEYSCDSDGNVFTINQRLVLNPQGVPDIVRKVKGSFGRFRVTKRKRYILVLVNEGDDWVVKFAGQLAEPFELSISHGSMLKPDELNLDKLQKVIFSPQFCRDQGEVIYFKQSRGRNVS